MKLHDLKLFIQDFFQSGIVVVVGSGISASHGLPTMGELATFLIENITLSRDDRSGIQWEELKKMLVAGVDLETCFKSIDIDHALENIIVKNVAQYIRDNENKVIQLLAAGKARLPIGQLLNHILTIDKYLPVITTNYDRLIEFSAEIEGIGIDSTFSGLYFGQFNLRKSTESLCCAIRQTSRRTSLKKEYLKHIKLFKPHGSLDWFDGGGKVIRCAIPLDDTPMIIAPGKTKYIKGYEQPFDIHRAKANEYIDSCSRVLVLGYGFNDGQLETHLRPRIAQGTPCLIITRSLTESAKAIVDSCDSVTAIVFGKENGVNGTRLIRKSHSIFFENIHIWELNLLIEEVLS